MNEHELKDYVVNELENIGSMISHLDPNELVPDDLLQKMKEKTERLLEDVEQS